MSKTVIYLDNSILGGYFDEEFASETRRLWRMKEQGIYRFVTSVVTLDEVSRAPEAVRKLFHQTFSDINALLQDSVESFDLAELYLQAGVLPQKYIDDARHVAICRIKTWKLSPAIEKRLLK